MPHPGTTAAQRKAIDAIARGDMTGVTKNMLTRLKRSRIVRETTGAWMRDEEGMTTFVDGVELSDEADRAWCEHFASPKESRKKS